MAIDGGLVTGPLIAAGAGAGLNLLGNALTKSPKLTKLPRYDQQTTGIINNLAQQGAQNANWQGQEQQARRNFSTNTIPGLAERFTSMGGGQRSSSFQGALGNAGADLEAQLAGMRGQFGLQQLGLGLQPTFDYNYTPSRQTGLSSLFNSLGGGLSSFGGAGLAQAFNGGGQQSLWQGGPKSGGNLGEILGSLSADQIPMAIAELQRLQGGQ